MTGRFEPGELVNVYIEGARIVRRDSTARLWLSLGDVECFIPAGLSGQTARITVERVAPKEWPPQIGDIWVDTDGDEWVAHGLPSGEVDFGPVGAVPGKVYDLPDNAAAHHGPMRLARRRGWTPDRPADAPPVDCCPDAPDAEP